MPDLPINWNVNFGFVIQATFTPSILKYHNYTAGPKVAENGKLSVSFETKKDQQDVKWDLAGKNLVARDSGSAWIDTASSQVAQIERKFLNLPGSLSSMTASSEYGPVAIGPNTFWLPRYVRMESVERDTRKSGVYLAEYSNCKKFGAEVTLVP